MTAAAKREVFTPERALAFSDGVFSVAITLLVIDLRLPITAEDGGPALLQALLSMGPKLLLFIFTFVVVGMSWLGHHRKFSYIRVVDGRMLWLNLIYLMMLSLVPFATQLLGEHRDRYAFASYGLVMVLVSLLSACVSLYGLQERFLRTPDLRRGVKLDMVLAPFLNGVVFLIAAVIALLYEARIAGWFLLMLIPASAFPGSLGRNQDRSETPASG
jgi:uncharacterized membrane protein